ncbi:hypothetical protein [Maridesulfovibrio sp.]|uniref:hypothetical protein n=1 Tax=Maridesulfovibrio sp. TaxID=2795000 RepID=UPI002AA85F7A|nr:hypothetical protein [Maridesulfovibrio sp.]
MKVVNSKVGNFLKGQSDEGLLGSEKEPGMSPELKKLAAREGVDPVLVQRARDREEEERDLRVLDAYNSFESGLQEILLDPESGLMLLRAGEAQSAVFKVNDYFTEEGGRLRDELPDDECRTRFMDILESRRRTAVDAVARHQSQEYQNWKESTAAKTIDSVLKGVNICPNAASLSYGERLLEGAVLRLYRGSNPELLQLRLITAKQSMYAGALESIGEKDPVSALIMTESWKEQLGAEHYEFLHEMFEPQARNQHMKQEFHLLRNMEDEQLEAELHDLKDDDMRRELAEMIRADRELRRKVEEQAEEERMNLICRELFKRFVDGVLSVEDILDSGLKAELRSMWLGIFSRKGVKGSDEALIKVVAGVIDDEISEEYQIYGAVLDGLGEVDAALLAALFMFKDNPESRLVVNGLREIGARSEAVSADQRDQAAAIRDFIHRVAALIGKGEPFSVIKVCNEIIADHFANGLAVKEIETGQRKVSEHESSAVMESGQTADELNKPESVDEAGDVAVENEPAAENGRDQPCKNNDEEYHDVES